MYSRSENLIEPQKVQKETKELKYLPDQKITAI